MALRLWQVASLGFLVSKFDIAVHAALVALENEEEERRRPIRRRRKEIKRRSCCVKYWLSREQMLHQSQYYNLKETPREKGPEGFRNYTRLQPEMFDELLDRIRPRTVKHDTTYRDDLALGFKLAVTLRFWQLGIHMYTWLLTSL